MSSIREDLNSFNKFAGERLAAGQPAASLDELFMEWQDRRARDEINHAIRRGLADLDAGHYELADQAMESIRAEFRIPKE